MSLDNVHQKSFNSRLNITDNYTLALMEVLKTKGHFQDFRKSSKEEDLGGIDWWVIYPKQKTELPIQFKIRDKQKDIPVCRFQPFYGIGHEKTVEGRDFRCLQGNKTSAYYVAIRNGTSFSEIYSITCAKLAKSVIKIDELWQATEKQGDNLPKGFFDPKHVNLWLEKDIRNRCVFRQDEGQVWWKKNYNEKSPKFNFYIPYAQRDWDVKLTSEDSILIERNVHDEVIR